MTIAPAAANAAALLQARKAPARAPLTATELKAAASARKAAVSADASKARSSQAFQAGDTRKSQARAKLQQLREWLKIVRKLYAQNPQGMARALAQAFKELKAAVAAYKDAGGEEMAAAGGAVDAAITPPPAAPDAGSSDDEGDQWAGRSDATAAPDASANPLSGPLEGHARYDAVLGEVRKMIGEDGLDFLKDVRGMVDDLRKLLEAARGQAAIRKRDKDTNAAFEEADASLKELGEAMSQMERQIRNDAPRAGLTLSVAA